jgi:hypothetical protein
VAGLLAEMQVRTAELDHFDLDDRQSFGRALASAVMREPHPDGGAAVDEAARAIAGAP